MTLKECRIKKGFSSLEIAKKLDISEEKYLNNENKPENIPINIAILYSKITGVDYDDIFFGNLV